jgi:hypothetical protein
MIDFLKGIWTLIWATLVSILVFSIGTIYSLGYSIFMSLSGRDWKSFFRFWIRTIDGFLASIGHALYEIAYALDIAWNVNGEIIEDMITHEENTTFGQKNISVSASVGKLEIDDKLNKFGKSFSKLLNLFFWQKQHAIDAWNYTIAKKELKDNFFAKKGKLQIKFKK